MVAQTELREGDICRIVDIGPDFLIRCRDQLIGKIVTFVSYGVYKQNGFISCIVKLIEGIKDKEGIILHRGSEIAFTNVKLEKLEPVNASEKKENDIYINQESREFIRIFVKKLTGYDITDKVIKDVCREIIEENKKS